MTNRIKQMQKKL